MIYDSERQSDDKLSPSAVSMRKIRLINRQIGLRQCKLTIPRSALKHLDDIKKASKLKGRDRTASLIISRARANLGVNEYSPPPLPLAGDEPVTIALNLTNDAVLYLRNIATNLRGVSFGVAFEAVISQAQVATPIPKQLELAEML